MRLKFKTSLASIACATLATLAMTSALSAQIKPIEAMSVEASSGKGAPKKFEELLDTKDLSKFRGYQTEEIPAGWVLQGKNLVFNGTGSGDIITRDTFRDFELQVEWSVEKAGNSGIMFRVTLGDSQPYQSGPEIQVLDDESAGDGKNELTAAGSLYGLYPAQNKKLNGPGKWNKSRIIVENDKITHYLNGVKVLEAESGSDDWNERLAKSKFKDWEKFNKSKEGHIAFQNHGDPVKFRSIRIKRLGDDSGAGLATDGQGAAATGAPTGGPEIPAIDAVDVEASSSGGRPPGKPKSEGGADGPGKKGGR